MPIVQQVRGLGLLNAVVISQQGEHSGQQWNSVNQLTWDICMRMAELGTTGFPSTAFLPS